MKRLDERIGRTCAVRQRSRILADMLDQIPVDDEEQNHDRHTNACKVNNTEWN